MCGADAVQAEAICSVVSSNPASWRRSSAAVLKWVGAHTSLALLLDSLVAETHNDELLQEVCYIFTLLSKIEFLASLSDSEFRDWALAEAD